MKILIGYPPLKSEKGIPLISQNRQFQFFKNKTLLYPVVLASAATLLKSKGYKVLWKDAIAENLNEKQFLTYLEKEQPDLFIFETKTPVIKLHWQLINSLKQKFPKMKIVLFGDHVTFLPEESMKKSKVDFILTGGDYDFLLLNLCNHLSKKQKLEPGIWYRENSKIKNTGKFQLNHNLDSLPLIDRDLTKWKHYQYEYNIPVRPYMYMMSSRDCWYGKCIFCSWPTLYPKCRTRSVKNVLDEVGTLIKKYKIKYIFDDAGTFPIGKWLNDFCKGMISRNYNKKIKYSCNMRFGALKLKDYQLMKEAGFHLLKFGLESGDDDILKSLNKGIKVKEIIEGCKLAKKAGLTIHLTMIVGHLGETREQALKTLNLAKKLMLSGLADILQATVLVPYPNTPLWQEAKKKKMFRFNPYAYERYDMKEPVLKTEMSPEEVMDICNSIYKKIVLSPKYILRHISKIRNLDDIKYTLRGIKAVFGHIKDFSK